MALGPSQASGLKGSERARGGGGRCNESFVHAAALLTCASSKLASVYTQRFTRLAPFPMLN
jgi:hypothetical protein